MDHLGNTIMDHLDTPPRGRQQIQESPGSRGFPGLGLGFGIHFENLGFGIGIWDSISKSGIWDWDLGFIFRIWDLGLGFGIWFFWANPRKSRKIPENPGKS